MYSVGEAQPQLYCYFTFIWSNFFNQKNYVVYFKVYIFIVHKYL